MLKKVLLAACLGALLPGCTSIEAAATGPQPIGVAPGERTLSMKVDDQSIENTASVNIAKADPDFYNANVNVVSFYASVLLVGEVPTQALKDKAEAVVRSIAEVKQVHNELVIGDASYYKARAVDSYITSRISSALLFTSGFPSSRSKITTSGGIVYLMGKLTHAEADQAVSIISGVSGVEKIVKLVDYLPAVPAEQPAATAGSGPA